MLSGRLLRAVVFYIYLCCCYGLRAPLAQRGKLLAVAFFAMCEVLAHGTAHTHTQGVCVCPRREYIVIYVHACVRRNHAPKKANVFSDCTVKRLAGCWIKFFSSLGSARQLLIPSSPGSSSCAIILTHPKREKQLCIGYVVYTTCTWKRSRDNRFDASMRYIHPWIWDLWCDASKFSTNYQIRRLWEPYFM